MNSHALKEASMGDLIEEYRRVTLEQKRASSSGDHKKANAAFQKIVLLIREFRNRGEAAFIQLRELLDDPRIEVRSWAAVHLLDTYPEKAEKTLEEIAAGLPSPIRLSAEMVLEEWRSGQLKIP
jgi:hypothetical protein